ncbi:putative zinc finger protein [Ixodes scapularis]
MWDLQYDDELSDAGNSDEPDSDIEALLYSKVHYEAEDLGSTEAAQAPALLTGDLASGLASAVAKGKASSKRRERGDAERLKVLEGASAAKRKKKRKLEVIVEEDGGDGSAEDRDASSVDAVDTIVLSSDDELIVFSEDSSQDISLNVEGTTETNKSHGDLWRVDVEDRYRINRGFRYHNQFSGVRCRNCNESGHLSKFCPQPKVNGYPLDLAVEGSI